ncbi:hypothetical protein [Roseibium album]|uniref:hypothetical protein n=1 Tax=Roseibium album TaxID=311410 RepID=UPI002493969C|nr:hypothetical protein [Roseibium album]
MSFFRTVDPADASVYEGAASLGSIAEAARETALFADNYNAAEHARTEAFDEARSAIREATGIELDNPQLLEPVSIPSPASAFDPVFNSALGREDPFKIWDNRIQEIMEQHPDKADMLSPFRLEGINKSALGKARASNERYELLSSTREDWPGFFAGLGGGFAGALQDPVTLATLPFGFGAGAARSVGGKILATTWREALISGVTEAAVQPTIQKWRAEAGLPAGLEEGLKNVGLATALGGVLGGAVRGVVEAPGAVRRRFSRGPDPGLTPPSVEKIADDLSPVRDDLPPATRAAVDVFDQDRAVMQTVRDELGEEMSADFGRMMQRSDRFAERLETSDPEDFTRFVRERELAQDPVLAEDFRTAKEALDQAEQRLVELESPLKARTVADTLEDIDPASAARTRAIETELKGQVPKKRLADLKAERAAIVETVGEEVLERAEREFRIGPQKKVKAARKRVREARGRFNAVSRTADARASGRLEAGRAVQRQGDQSARSAPDPEARPVPPSRAASNDPFEPGSPEAQAQTDALANQVEPEDEISDVLMVQEDGRITSESRMVAEALEEADRGTYLADLVEACKLS